MAKEHAAALKGMALCRALSPAGAFTGSPRAVEECFEIVRPVLEHAIALINGETKHED